MKERYVKLLTVFCWILVGVVIILVGVFWYRIVTSLKDSQVAIEKEESPNVQLQDLTYPYWSTKTGKKYYPKDCSSAPSIPEERKIYYTSIEEAKIYGKDPSVRCQ